MNSRRIPEFGPLDLRLRFAEHPLDCLEGGDALAINTEWSVFRNPDFDRMKKLLRAPLIFDAGISTHPKRCASTALPTIRLAGPRSRRSQSPLSTLSCEPTRDLR
jgi:hypothetical protein